MPSDYYAVLLALGIALGLGLVIVAMSALVGPRKGGKIKLSPYESGEPLLDTSRKRISVLFFLIAIDFVIFDVEAAFLYPWVLVLKDGGWALFAAVMIFVVLIVVGFAYLWIKGGLNLTPSRRLGLIKESDHE